MRPGTRWQARVAEPPAPAASPLDASRPRPALSANTRLAIFAVGLVLALVGGFAIGRATGASEEAAGPPGAPGGTATTATDGHAHADGNAAGTAGGSAEIGGLTVSAAGYRLVPQQTQFA